MVKPLQFLKDVKNELIKVIWPTRSQTIKMTIYVIVISLLVAALLGLVDLGLDQVMCRYVVENADCNIID